MFVLTVGRLRLDLRKDGTGLVSRRRVLGEPAAVRIPLDPEDAASLAKMRGLMRATCLGFLVGSAACVGAAVQLLVDDKVVIGIAVAAVGLALATLAMIFLFLGVHRYDRGHFFVLDASVVDEFRVSGLAERQLLGERPKHAESERAQERLWELARRLTSPDGSAHGS